MTAATPHTATALPAPRTGAADDAPGAAMPEPRRRGPGARPAHHYWDVATARWVVRTTTGRP